MKSLSKHEIEVFLNSIKGKTEEEVKNCIEERYEQFLTSLPSGEYKKFLLYNIYNKHKSKSEEVCELSFFSGELNFINAIEDEHIKRLAFCLLCVSKKYNRASKWINVRFPECLKFGFKDSEIRKIKLEDLKELQDFGIDFCVIGSNKPVLCFKLPEFDIGEELPSFEENNSALFFERWCLR